MIRTLLDSYVDKYSQRPLTTRSTGRRSTWPHAAMSRPPPVNAGV